MLFDETILNGSDNGEIQVGVIQHSMQEQMNTLLGRNPAKVDATYVADSPFDLRIANLLLVLIPL